MYRFPKYYRCYSYMTRYDLKKSLSFDTTIILLLRPEGVGDGSGRGWLGVVDTHLV